MLDVAIADFLSSIKREREFDEPLRALLRAQGFYDIAFVHGRSEFGRDFIAKRHEDCGERQYAVQSKAGDIGADAWRDVRNQLEDIRTTDFGHPNFNHKLPRVGILVTTGELVGDARLLADAYKQKFATSDATFAIDFWGPGRLIEYVASGPNAALAGRDPGPLLRIIGLIDAQDCDERELERFSRRWIPAEGQQAQPASVIEAAVVANALSRRDRLDLACLVCLDLLRAAVVGAHGAGELCDDLWASATQAGGLFSQYANELWGRCKTSDLTLDALALANQNEFGFFATYSVRCSRVIELLGLLGLRRRAEGEDSSEIADYLASFIGRQPGAAHPLSDRYAVSMVPAALLLGPDRSDVLRPWLHEAVVWLGDRFEDGGGLGGVEASPEGEVAYLLSAFEHVDVLRRRSSYLATIILDLICVLGLGDLYPDAWRDLQMVNALPELLHVPDTRAQYLYDGEGIEQEVGAPYSQVWQPRDGWKIADHHDQDSPSWLEQLGKRWEKLALSSVTRDRHDPGLMRRTAGESDVGHLS